MNRRSATWVLRILLLASLLATPLVAHGGVGAVGSEVAAPGGTPFVASTPDDTASTGTGSTGNGSTGTVPTDTANPFLPEERDLTDCLGLLQRPGCGSEARGGLGQTLVAIAMIGGLVLIFGRVAWGIRRNRARQELPGAAPDDTHDADDADAAAGSVVRDDAPDPPRP